MEITLSEGRKITIDLHRITIREYRELIKVKTDTTEGQDREDELIGKVVGLSIAEVQALPTPDYKQIATCFWKAATEPLADPTSASAST